MDHGARVLKKGLTFEKVGKILIFCLLGGIGLLILITLITLAMGGDVDDIMRSLFFGQYGMYWFVNFFDAIAYLAILVGCFGIPLYFFGLVYVGLGQIAENTRK